MKPPRQARERTPEHIAAFIDAFFGTGNEVWPDRDPTSRTGRNLVPFLQVLHDPSDVPVVLPRRRPGQEERLTAYVIALDPAHATAAAELLTAFVGPSYTYFDGRPARLDPSDPVDQAVLQFAGLGTTFTLASPVPDKDGPTWAALRLLQQTVAKRPKRAWHVPKPVGRLLAEFETAVAAGDNNSSAQVLEQLTASGGLNGANLAHLRIKRLARLGRDTEVLRLPDLADIIAAQPPTPVCDAILTATYTGALADALANGDLFAARDHLVNRGVLVPALMNGSLDGLSAQALAVLALAAAVREDATAARRLLSHSAARERLQSLAPAIVEALTQARLPNVHGPLPSDTTMTVSPRVPLSAPSGWPELVTALVEDHEEAKVVLANEQWREWAPPASMDEQIATSLVGLDDTGAKRVWSIVGPFLDADGYRQPAARSANELIQNALAHSRFSPGDLAGLVALTEIVLRAAPSRQGYARLLDDLRAECDRWASPERATVALDLTDLLVRSACPDHEARLRLAMAILEPLRAHSSRLDPDQAAFASQLSRELETDLVWPVTEDADSAGVWARAVASRVLLYSLDTGALTRTADALSKLAPGVTIALSHDRVGSPQLKQHARHADVIVLATRCATHAATGFIRANSAKGVMVREANGSGSASLLRAAIAGLRSKAMR